MEPFREVAVVQLGVVPMLDVEVDQRRKGCGRLSHGDLRLGVRLLIVVLTGRIRGVPLEVPEVVEKRGEDGAGDGDQHHPYCQQIRNRGREGELEQRDEHAGYHPDDKEERTEIGVISREELDTIEERRFCLRIGGGSGLAHE